MFVQYMVVAEALPSHDEDNKTDTLEDGCTGDLRLGQAIVKQWDDPFLHAQCAKKQCKGGCCSGSVFIT